MKTPTTMLVLGGLLSVSIGCGPMDPPQWEKTYRIRAADPSGPAIEIRASEYKAWGTSHYGTPTIVVTDRNGVSWQIWVQGNDPEHWLIYRVEDGKEPVAVPIEKIQVTTRRVI